MFLVTFNYPVISICIFFPWTVHVVGEEKKIKFR